MDANVTSSRTRPETVVARAGRPGDPGPSRVSVRVQKSYPWTIIAVAGEMDLRVGPLVSDLVSASDVHVVVDLREVTFMDASGLGVLMDVQRRAVRAGACVRLVAPSRPARRILRLTRTDRAFPTFGSVAEAISSPVLA